MREIEKEVAERFPKDVAQHVMTVEVDDGVHRCLHFGRPGSGVHSFRLVTWPGHLYIGGDCDDFVFRRLTDMFEFFRSDRGRVNLSYWAEKLTAASARGGYEEYSERMFREAIEQRVTEWIDGEDLSEEQIAKLREQVADEVMSCASDGEQAAHIAARDFRFNGDEVFTDFWETGLREYSYGFTWACHAIVWAIAQYDAHADRPAGEEADHPCR